MHVRYTHVETSQTFSEKDVEQEIVDLNAKLFAIKLKIKSCKNEIIKLEFEKGYVNEAAGSAVNELKQNAMVLHNSAIEGK